MKLPDELVKRAAKVTLADVRVFNEESHLDYGPSYLPATLADLVEVALSEGGEVGWIGDTNVDELFDYVPDQYAHVIDVSKMDRVLVIPLDSKE